MYPHERSLVKKLEGKPFALIGVNSDGNRARLKEILQKQNITWRSFWDGSTGGPIDRAWNIQNWPTIYLLDHRGIIRYKFVESDAFDGAIDTLLKEAEGLTKPTPSHGKRSAAEQ